MTLLQLNSLSRDECRSSRGYRQSVLGRGDVDDRVLPEAILPLLEQLAVCKDVRPILHRRFDMPRWLASHGISSASPAKSAGARPQYSPMRDGTRALTEGFVRAQARLWT